MIMKSLPRQLLISTENNRNSRNFHAGAFELINYPEKGASLAFLKTEVLLPWNRYCVRW